MEASEPKWVNPNDILYGVNSLRLGGLQIIWSQIVKEYLSVHDPIMVDEKLTTRIVILKEDFLKF